MPPILAVAAIISTIATVLTVAVVAAAVIGGVILLAKALMPKIPGANAASMGALNQSLSVDAFRVIVLGKAPCGNDIRYWETYGATGFDQIIAAATHKITSFQKFYIEGREVTFAGGTSTGAATGTVAVSTIGNAAYVPASTDFAGCLTKDNVAVGVTATTVTGTTGGGTLWTSASSFTGCAYYRLKWTYNQSKMPNGFPSKTTQIVEGSPVYDPRKDSTNGGSGSHRPGDNTTWTYSDLDSNSVPIGRNNALQMLRYLLGWHITNPATSAYVLVDGRGVDPNDINYASFIAAANTCETEQYYTDCILSTGDSHTTNEAIIAGGAGGVILDTGGLWAYHPATNDTASIAVAFNDDDIVSGVVWNPKDTIANLYNQVGGNFIDPSATSVYQPQPYPVVTDATYLSQDGVAKRMTLDFQNVQSASLAQKLARIALNKNRVTGTFTASFTYKALQANNYDCVTLSFASFGWTNKLFRVISMSINPIGAIDMVLQEEFAAIYTGGTINTYNPPVAGAIYNPRQQIALAGLSVTASTFFAAGTQQVDGLTVTWTAVAENVKRVEVQTRVTGSTNWIDAGIANYGVGAVDVYPLLQNTGYDIQARTVSINDVAGAWVSTTQTTGNNTTATQNQTFNQATDPALTQTVNDGAFWTNSAAGTFNQRIGGAWITVAVISNIVDGTVLFDSGTPGAFSMTVPSGALAHVWIEIWGAGGGANAWVGVRGGGGGGYSKHYMAVTPGSTNITGTIGAGGAGLSTIGIATTGGTTSVTSPSITANGGAGGSNGAGGAGGTASGGSVTNTTGTAGTTSYGGGSPNGGANQTTSAIGNTPGGGGYGAGGAAFKGAAGRVLITAKT